MARIEVGPARAGHPLTTGKTLRAIVRSAQRNRSAVQRDAQHRPCPYHPQDDGTSAGVWGVFTLKSAFQPIFAFDRGKLSIAAFEGLIRPFRDDEALSPATFFNCIPAADRLHVETLTRTLHLLNAGACLDREGGDLHQFRSVAVHRAGGRRAALRDMRLVLHEAGIDPRRVVCEVTEQKSASQRSAVRLRAGAEGARLPHRRRRLRRAKIPTSSRIRDAEARHRQVRRAMDHPADGDGTRLCAAARDGDDLRRAGHRDRVRRHRGGLAAGARRKIRRLDGAGLRAGAAGDRADQLLAVPAARQRRPLPPRMRIPAWRPAEPRAGAHAPPRKFWAAGVA